MKKEVKVDKEAIGKVYHRDCILLAGFAIFMWCILSTILRQALQLTEEMNTRLVMMLAALITGSALSLGLFAVYLHLKKNKNEIYKEDLENLKLLKESE